MSVQERALSISDQALAAIDSYLSSGGWESIGVNDDVYGYLKSDGDLQLIKAVGVINYEPSVVAAYIGDHTHAKEYDEILIDSKVLHDFGDLQVLHNTYQAVWPVSNRDFVFATNKYTRDSDIIRVAKSIDLQVPEQPDTVRGEVIASAYYFKNIEDIATEVTYFVCSDPKGAIPKAIVDLIGRKQVSNVNKLRAALTKHNS